MTDDATDTATVGGALLSAQPAPAVADGELDAADALALLRGGSGMAPPLLDQPLARFATRPPVSCALERMVSSVVSSTPLDATGYT